MKKHVQVGLPEVTYDRLRRIAKKENRSIEDLVREAIEAHLRAAQDADPLNDLIGSVGIGGGWSTRKDWRHPLLNRGSQ